MRKVMTFLAASVVSATLTSAADVKLGQEAYKRECEGCHEMNGAPVASVVKAMLKQKVTMRDLRAKEVQAQSNDEWKKMITQGVGKMKPVKSITPEEIDGVVAYMRSWKKK